jgi:acetylornithine deacetylase/succinyl-diaminopimelate desuccinylase-like protein
MNEHKLTIDFDTNVTVSDILEQRELDVTSLKQDNPEGPVRKHVDEIEALDQRADELAQIANFIQAHGVTRPTEEDFKPKSQRWSRNVKTKAEKLKENPNYVERRGRQRTTFTKTVTFVALDGGNFKRAGRGRAKLGETRETFVIYYTHMDTVSNGTWTRKELETFAKHS